MGMLMHRHLASEEPAENIEKVAADESAETVDPPKKRGRSKKQ